MLQASETNLKLKPDKFEDFGTSVLNPDPCCALAAFSYIYETGNRGYSIIKSASSVRSRVGEAERLGAGEGPL